MKAPRTLMLQNVATWAKFSAMAAFVILGFAIGKGELVDTSPPKLGEQAGGLSVFNPGQLTFALSAWG